MIKSTLEIMLVRKLQIHKVFGRCDFVRTVQF